MIISRKRLLIGFTLLALATILFAFSVLVQKRRGEVQLELHKLFGSAVTLDAVESSLWGGIGFSVSNFRIADDPQFAATPFVQAKELRLGVSFWHLLLGRLVITSLTFTQPEFQFITNEEGLLNLAALATRKKELAAFPRLRTSPGEKRSAPVTFLITRIKVIDGRVDFIDRSVRAPAELRIKNIELDVGGVDLAARAKIKLAASLTEGLGRDVRMEGELGPLTLGSGWSQQPVNLELQFDSLYLPMLARAIPFLRDRVPRELDITGPMFFQAKLSGTLQQPRFGNVTLKVPFLGSSEYNAVLEGNAEFTKSRDWADAPIAGKLTLSAISLSQLRKLPLLRQTLPAAFAIDGTVNIYSLFEGTWNQLRIGALVGANKSEIRVPGWFHKPAGMPVALRAQISRGKDRFKLYPAELSLGTAKALVSGVLTQSQESRISITLSSGQTSLKTLAPLLAPAPWDSFSGGIEWDLTLEKNLTRSANGWELHGKLSLAQGVLRHKTSGRKIDQLMGELTFSGSRVRAQDLSFRLGSSSVAMTLDLKDWNPLSGRYALRSPEIDLTDIPPFTGAGRMQDVVSNGEVAIEEDLPLLRGTLASSTGTIQTIPYRNLLTHIAWSASRVSFKELRAAAFEGKLSGGGSWDFGSWQARSFRLAPRFDAPSLNAVLAQWAPDLKDRFEGQIEFNGDFDGGAPADEPLTQTLNGSGTARISKGRIRDFNLIGHLFFRASGPEQTAKAPQRLSENLAAILKRSHTPIEDFKATMTVNAGRIRTNHLSFSTPEYAITAAGWVGFDGTTRWNGLLVFSPDVTQELQREHRAVRYFIDRKGRLSVAFRLDGKLSNFRIRPENRALAQALRWGIWQRGDDLTGQTGRGGKEWLPDSLERLLHR